MDHNKVLHFEIAHGGPGPSRASTAPSNGASAAARGAPEPAPVRSPKPEKLMRLLSDRNLKLLRLIRTAEPKTLAELSRLSGRPKASLTRTLARLSDLGIVTLRKSRGRGKVPLVTCDRVRLEVSLLPEEPKTHDQT